MESRDEAPSQRSRALSPDEQLCNPQLPPSLPVLYSPRPLPSSLLMKLPELSHFRPSALLHSSSTTDHSAPPAAADRNPRRLTIHSTSDIKDSRPLPTGLVGAFRAWLEMSEQEAEQAELRILRYVLSLLAASGLPCDACRLEGRPPSRTLASIPVSRSLEWKG